MATQAVPPVPIGYPWSMRIQLVSSNPDPIFPVGVEITGHIRKEVDDDTILATLTTADGSVVRVDDNTIELSLTADASAAWEPCQWVCDLVRTDTDPDEFLGITINHTAILPVTRGLT